MLNFFKKKKSKSSDKRDVNRNCFVYLKGKDFVFSTNSLADIGLGLTTRIITKELDSTNDLKEEIQIALDEFKIDVKYDKDEYEKIYKELLNQAGIKNMLEIEKKYSCFSIVENKDGFRIAKMIWDYKNKGLMDSGEKYDCTDLNEVTGFLSSYTLTEREYSSQLINSIDSHKDPVLERISKLLSVIPEKATGLDITIFPSQDWDGTFNIYANIEGPDLFVLQKNIEEYASIFSIKHTENGIEPKVPYLEPNRQAFEVNEVLTNSIGKWLFDILKEVDLSKVSIPIKICSDEGWGETLPIIIK